MDLHPVGLFPGSKARKIIPITGRIHSFIHLTNIYWDFIMYQALQKILRYTHKYSSKLDKMVCMKLRLLAGIWWVFHAQELLHTTAPSSAHFCPLAHHFFCHMAFFQLFSYTELFEQASSPSAWLFSPSCPNPFMLSHSWMPPNKCLCIMSQVTVYSCRHKLHKCIYLRDYFSVCPPSVL